MLISTSQNKMPQAIHRCLFALLCACLFVGLAQAELYKHIDADGNITYTDVPPTENAEAINLPPVNVMESTKATPIKPPKPDTAPDTGYQDLKISQPTPDQTFHDNTGSLTVQVTVNPVLHPGHSLRIMLDGKLIQQGRANQAELTDLNRGSHTVAAAVVDQNHKIMIESAAVTFHLKKHSVINNPLPKPPTPPKPTPKP